MCIWSIMQFLVRTQHKTNSSSTNRNKPYFNLVLSVFSKPMTRSCFLSCCCGGCYGFFCILLFVGHVFIALGSVLWTRIPRVLGKVQDKTMSLVLKVQQCKKQEKSGRKSCPAVQWQSVTGEKSTISPFSIKTRVDGSTLFKHTQTPLDRLFPSSLQC